MISIIIFYFYFDSLLVYLHVLLYGFSKDNITFEYSSLFNDDTGFNAIKNSLIQAPNILFETWEVYYISQFMVNIRIVCY